MFLRFRRATLLAILFMYFYLAIPENAYAYLDPGSGSYFLQLLLAGLLGATFMIKTFWTRLKGFFVSLFSKSQDHARGIQE